MFVLTCVKLQWCRWERNNCLASKYKFVNCWIVIAFSLLNLALQFEQSNVFSISSRTLKVDSTWLDAVTDILYPTWGELKVSDTIDLEILFTIM